MIEKNSPYGTPGLKQLLLAFAFIRLQNLHLVVGGTAVPVNFEAKSFFDTFFAEKKV